VSRNFETDLFWTIVDCFASMRKPSKLRPCAPIGTPRRRSVTSGDSFASLAKFESLRLSICSCSVCFFSNSSFFTSCFTMPMNQPVGFFTLDVFHVSRNFETDLFWTIVDCFASMRKPSKLRPCAPIGTPRRRSVTSGDNSTSLATFESLRLSNCSSNHWRCLLVVGLVPWASSVPTSWCFSALGVSTVEI